MKLRGVRWLGGLGLAAVVLAATGPLSRGRQSAVRQLPRPQTATPGSSATPRVVPKFEVVAETRLLMEGLTMPNYQSLERLLRDKPDQETWSFARGQALLIAETGNLLLLRPPRNQGRDIWMQRAMDLRQAASALARAAGTTDLERSRAALRDVAGACNRCHQTFRIPVRVGPEAGPGRTPGAKGTDRDT
jgi:hypothetical protein